MPLQVDYTRFALFFNFTEATWLNESAPHWEVDLSHRAIPSDSECLVPHLAYMQKVAISVANPQAMVEYLRRMSYQQILALQKQVLTFTSLSC